LSSKHFRLLAAGAVATLAAGAIAAAPARSAVPATAPGTAWGTGTLTDANLHSLVGQMTVAEEIGMVHGASDTTCSTAAIGCVGQAGTVVGVPRLGVPPTRLTDGPAGVRLSHVETAMPAPVGLTASFDRNAAQLFGKTVGDEGRATNQDVWLGPMTNAVSFITGGRNFETLGEDPYLAGELLAPEVKGVQGEGLIATLKHWIENDFENNRGSASVKIDDQTTHETEMQAFEQGVKAGAGSVMCSYNRINDVYGCGNSHTLQDLLKNELGFKGYVMSDWGGKSTGIFLTSVDDVPAALADGFRMIALGSDGGYMMQAASATVSAARAAAQRGA
jgi:beta-glucosidase